MKIKILSVAVFAIFLSLFQTACISKTEDTAAAVKQDYTQIFQHSWQLDLPSMIENYDKTISVPKAMQETTLTVVSNQDGQQEVFGKSFVNNYFGPVKLDTANGSLQFGQLGATRMAGPGMDLEQKYFIMLSQVSSYAIQDDMLILFGKDKDGKTKKFAAFTQIPLIKR